MESSEQERLQLEVIQALCTLSRDHLVDLCDFLDIAGPALEHVSGKSKTFCISLISTYLQRDELEDLEDKGMAELLCFREKINEYQTESEASTEFVSQPTEQVNMSQMKNEQTAQNNEQERQQSHTEEKIEEQAKLAEQIEALQAKLSFPT